MAEKKTSRIKVRCLDKFIDKHTKKLHKKGDVFTVTEERMKEILAVGALVEKYAPPTKEEK